MAVNTTIQAKAQREIDRVVGRNRLPDFSDRPTMPYLEAIYREALRCRQPLNMALPHCLMEDDYYKGYFIPKGWWFLFLIAFMLVYCHHGFGDNRHDCVCKYMASLYVNCVLCENWRKPQGPWRTTKAFTPNHLPSNPKDFLTKMETSTTTTGYWRMDLGGGDLLPLPLYSHFHNKRHRGCVGKHVASSTVGVHKIF